MSFDPSSPSFIVLSIAVAAVVTYAVTAFRMTGREDPWLATLIRPLVYVYARCLHRLQVVPAGKDPIPEHGAAVLVANHRSGVDPLLLGLVTRRRIHFLMAREYFETPGLRWGFRVLGCIPVNRNGNDLGATKAALKALHDGKVIGIFPQGGIREAGESLEGKAGVALLALRSGAPVIPFHIDGSPNLDSVFRALITPSRATVTRGTPAVIEAEGRKKPSREELARITTSILDAVAALDPKRGAKADSSAQKPETPLTER